MYTYIHALVTPPTYQSARAHLFPSMGSFVWFLRRNRSALNKAGAVLVVAGRILVDQEKIDALVLQVGAQAARRGTR